MKLFGFLLIIGGILGLFVFGDFFLKTYNESTDIDRVCKQYFEKKNSQPTEPDLRLEVVDPLQVECFERKSKTNDIKSLLLQNPQAIIGINLSLASAIVGFSLVKKSGNNKKRKK
jgi:hypothetical protein